MGMVDIEYKREVERIAIAEGRIKLKNRTIEAIKNNEIKKGDPFKTAETAALLAIKNTSNVIPHCHPLPIMYADIHFSIEDDNVICRCEVKTSYRTGVEMEALHGVSIALLTIWDMVKYLEKNEQGNYDTTEIYNIKVVKKIKGEQI